MSDLNQALQAPLAVLAFLASCPEVSGGGGREGGGGGLFLVASALFHPSQTCRFYACLILQRLEMSEVARAAVEGMNGMLRLAYQRVRREMTAAT